MLCHSMYVYVKCVLVKTFQCALLRAVALTSVGLRLRAEAKVRRLAAVARSPTMRIA
jgi:hypothetical protein